ncbi:phosphodiester glycosidase family protein [bacterium]|nr:phosphodiester glycosidase family protein [bacterium]
MYAEALAQRRIFCSEKMVLKLGIVLMALAVFSGQGMPDVEYTAEGALKGYIQNNNIFEKEQSDDALFLLKNKWEQDLKSKYGNNSVKHLDNGVAYISMVKYINSHRTKINIAEINRNINPNIEIIPQLSSSKMHSKSKIWKIVEDDEVLIAVNGTYFKQDTGTPLGALVINGDIISGPIYERAGFAITETGFSTSKIAFTGELKSNNEIIKIDNINQPRMMASNVLIYTSKWGSKTPATIKPSANIAIRNNRIIEKSNNPVSIPYDGFVINAPIEVLKNLKSGDDVEVHYSLTPNMNADNIISGGPYLIKEGSIYVDTAIEKLNAISGRNPRTAIGYTKDNVMIMVTVDGRKEGSSGLTLNELAQLMKSLGCYEAINLDGGSSTVMYVGGKIYSGTNIKNAVSISNALVVRKKA